MMYSDPVGYPGLVMLALGFVPFFAALLAARRRNRIAGASTEGARSRRSLAGIVVQTLGILVVAAGPVRPLLPAAAPRSLVDAIVVAVLMAATAGLFAAASRALGRNWSLVARTRDDHELVQSGPFAWVRHPIYVALALFMLAIAVAYGHLSHLWIGAPLYAVGAWLRIAEEERLLRAMFGPAYDAYAARVKRFIPGVF